MDRLFTNMETVCEVSAALLHRLHEAIAEPDREAVVIGDALFTSSPPSRLSVEVYGSVSVRKRPHVRFSLKETYSSRQREL